jgi:P4 family phage/plasmid primase-like protien
MYSKKTSDNPHYYSNNQKFERFIKERKVKNKEEEFTNTSLSKYPFTFKIDEQEYEKFIELYQNVMEETQLCITERQREIGMILLDFDFNMNGSVYERMYREEHYKKIVSIMMELMDLYYPNIDEEYKQAFVTEKDGPTVNEEKKKTKDGFHIAFPLFEIDLVGRYLLRDELVYRVKKEKVFDFDFTNSIEDVIDISVIYRNGWMMYGSCKPGGKPYMLTRIYHNLKKITYSYTKQELVSLLSLRTKGKIYYNIVDEVLEEKDLKQKIDSISKKYIKKTEITVPIQEKIDFQTEKIKTHLIEDSDIKIEDITRKKMDVKDKEMIDYSKELIKLLSPKRADSYQDWVTLGWTLKNIHDSLLNDFIAFSKQNPDKYEEGCCEKMWQSSKNYSESNKGYTIRSLEWWAKNDNPTKYRELLQKTVNGSIKDIIESGLTHFNLAMILKKLFGNNYICTSMKSKTWRYFQNHRWNKLEETHFPLQMLVMSNESNSIKMMIMNYINEKIIEAINTNDDNGSITQELGKKKASLKSKLENNEFYSGFANVCMKVFYDEKAENRFDTNINLIGFENGVYDLSFRDSKTGTVGQFREGMPEDWITFTTGKKYVDYSLEHPLVKELLDILRTIQPKQHVLNYVLRYLASRFFGKNREQQLVIWTGSGGNGKSILVELMKMALGEYTCNLSVSTLTMKRKESSAASPDLYKIKGVRLVLFQEPEHNDVIHVGVMKELTGNDAITARPLYGAPIEFVPQCGFLLLCNIIPILASLDGGTKRRIIVVPFPSKFVDNPNPNNPNEFKKDPDLSEKLKNYVEPFVWLLLNVYYPDYVSNGLYEPDEVVHTTEDYKQNNDKFIDYFIHYTNITKDKRDKIQISTIYDHYKAINRNEGKIATKKELMEYLKNLNLITSGRSKFAYGIKLLSEEEIAARDLEEAEKVLSETVI